jgi:hypothetical protein
MFEFATRGLGLGWFESSNLKLKYPTIDYNSLIKDFIGCNPGFRTYSIFDHDWKLNIISNFIGQ